MDISLPIWLQAVAARFNVTGVRSQSQAIDTNCGLLVLLLKKWLC
jgi:hypothetical protein